MDAGRDASVEPSDAPSGGDAVADAGAMGSGSVSGTIGANAWPSVMSALWIGNPQSNPTEIFLFDAPVACASITSPNWDKPLGNTQILELGVNGTTARTYAVPAEADVNYLRAQANPTADSGSVTIASITPTTKIVGTFTAKFGADTLTGSFEAIYCAAGVEP